MKAEGIIASKVKEMPKGGIIMKVTIPDMGDTFQAFISPEAKVRGIETLQIGDKVNCEWDGVFSSKDQVRLDGLKVTPLAVSKVPVPKSIGL